VKRREGELSGAGGLKLYWQAWLPPRPVASVVIAHGAGEHSGRYEHVGSRLAHSSYAAHAHEHRGHGRSQGRPATIDSIDDVVADLRTFIAKCREQAPDRPLFLLGHSMGGCISLAYACRHQHEIDGLILSSPLASTAAAAAPLRAISKALGVLAPTLGIYAVETEAISRDPEIVRDYETDPLVFHGKLPARTVAELTRAAESFPSEVPKLRLPLLVFHGTGDRITPPAGSEMVVERAASEDKTLRLLNGLYHETMNEPERSEVLEMVVSWLDLRTKR
jgi:alpha-beta hydrolase superfamily lysophospholipase